MKRFIRFELKVMSLPVLLALQRGLNHVLAVECEQGGGVNSELASLLHFQCLDVADEIKELKEKQS